MPAWIAGIATACMIRAAHESIFVYGGVYTIVLTGLGAAMATLLAWRIQRRRARMTTATA